MPSHSSPFLFSFLASFINQRQRRFSGSKLSESSTSYSLLSLLILLTVCLISVTQEAQATINTSELKNLAKHQQWQHLLFYKNGKAEVISPNFYLTDKNSTQKALFSPYQELLATIEAVHDEKTVCKYPARYFWLNKHIPMLQADLSHCHTLPDATQDISLLLVSSYLKNPASSFGHVLVKQSQNSSYQTQANSKNLKKEIKSLSSDDLLNQSYNFGARIPQNENGVLYALKGLFGIYDAGFSKADFFKQDAVYSKNEQRDMWEYVLNLDTFNTTLLNYHLHEAESARFRYYFIKQNCGYRSGEILELISDVATTNRLGGWYAPDFVFDQLVEADQFARLVTDKKTNPNLNLNLSPKTGTNQSLTNTDRTPRAPLIKQVRYLPSEQTQLRQKLVQLPKPVQSSINAFIKHEDITVLDQLSEDNQALALDFLIIHRNYKLSQAKEESKERQEIIKKQLIGNRFNLSAGDTLSKFPVKYKESPAYSNKTALTSMTLSDDQLGIGLTMFSKDPLNKHIDINKRFEAMKFKVTYDYDDEHELQFDEFVFLDMQQIENINEPLADEAKLSWQLKTGVENDPIYDEGNMTYAEGGIGIGIQASENLLGYGFINTHVHDQDSHIDLSTQLGMRIKNISGDRTGEMEYQIRKRDGYDIVQTTQITARQSINKNNDARLTLSYTDNPNLDTQTDDNHQVGIEVGFHHYW